MISDIPKTKYPIICSPMFSVSDVNLAVACAKAGILPSLIHFNTDDYIEFERKLKEYFEKSEESPILIATDDTCLKDYSFLNMCKNYNVSMFEILEYHNDVTLFKELVKTIHTVKNLGFNVSIKILTGHKAVKKIIDNFGPIDFVTLKGPKGAGRGYDNIDLETEIISIKKEFPSLGIIASGGINNSTDIKHMLSLGVDYVSLGTVFCASTESNISVEAKQKIIDSNVNDLKRLSTGYQHKSLVFSLANEETISDNYNNSIGLNLGVSTGRSGHVYVGDGISEITKIEPIQDIVNRLTQHLN